VNVANLFSKALLLSAILSIGQLAQPAASAWDWPVASPEGQGMSSSQLQAIQERLAAKKTRAFLVIRNDQIVLEWYAPGIAATNKQGTASLAKALAGGLSLAVAITDGRISIDDPAAKFVPQWKNDPRKSKITIRHLGSHTSGLSDSTSEGVKHEEQPGWMGDFWKRLDPPRDPFTLARDETPTLSAPGEKMQYSNPGIGMMTYCVTAAMQGGEHKDIRALLRDRVMRPIGVADGDWSIGYGKTFVVDGLPLVATWGGGAYTPRATARIGRLVLREGNWEGRQILSQAAVGRMSGDAGLVGHCGMGWWSNGGQRYGKLPKDAVWGAGAGDQLLLVVPSLNLIMVRNGEALVPGRGEPPIRTNDVFTLYHDYRARILFEPLIEAVTNSSRSSRREEAHFDRPEINQSLLTSAATNPVPRSAFIKEVRWAPAETIRRAAKGSDNWPLTWADDDVIYAAYGDGNGFEPFDQEKLSLGLARIDGGPEDFRGQNLRALSLRAVGDGAKGRKASGLLCVNGVLYLWMRNVGNSQLAWSSDHGATWSCAAWRFTNSFGCPTLVNFGRNYDGNEDGFAYVCSPDAEDAYHTADQFVLARVPLARIRERDAYEFFRGSFIHGNTALWTTNLAQRNAILKCAGACYRPSLTYNSGLKRFLLVHPRPNAGSRDAAGKIDTRIHGGLSIYEAPQPWGPWSVAFETDEWDVGPGDSASFPAKWISGDGRTLHLVFSGDDSFSVRRAQFIVGDDQ
jgi:CubicO group peptidase (beta-lactamase class C family)